MALRMLAWAGTAMLARVPTWMSSPSVMASTIITLTHCDAVRRGQVTINKAAAGWPGAGDASQCYATPIDYQS